MQLHIEYLRITNQISSQLFNNSLNVSNMNISYL